MTSPYMKKFANSGHRVFFMTHPRHFDEPESKYWRKWTRTSALLGFNEERLRDPRRMYLGVDEEWAKQHPDDIACTIDGESAPPL